MIMLVFRGPRAALMISPASWRAMSRWRWADAATAFFAISPLGHFADSAPRRGHADGR